MQIKYILNSLFLATLCVSAPAARDDCKELKTFLSDEAMDECKVNANGELIELTYNTYDEKTTEEAYKKALSYPTIKKLTFNDQYSDCKQLTYGLTNLKNLEELNISSFRGDLVPNTLKGLTSLKKFTFDSGDYNMSEFTKQNFEELGTLTNLESLTFAFTSLNPEGLKSLQNLNKVTSLTLDCNGKGGMDVVGCLSNLKNLKELTIPYDVKNQKDVDAIAAYTNLEKLTIEFRKGEINCDNFKNLTKLTTLDLKIEDVNEVPSCVNTIPNLQKLTYNGKDIPVKNGAKTPANTTNPVNPVGNQTPENNTNQTPATNQAPATNQVVGNPVAPNNTTQTAADQKSGAGSTIVHAINYLPVIALIFGMLL